MKKLEKGMKKLFPQPYIYKEAEGEYCISDCAYYNLYGALLDLEMEGADEVSLKTIKRVLKQLAYAKKMWELHNANKS